MVPEHADNGGDLGLSPHPDKVQETSKALGSGEQPLSTVGGLPTPPATVVQAELPGGLSTVLKNASIIDEHRTIMGRWLKRFNLPKGG